MVIDTLTIRKALQIQFDDEIVKKMSTSKHRAVTVATANLEDIPLEEALKEEKDFTEAEMTAMWVFMDLGRSDLAAQHGLVDLDRYVHVIGSG